jgi:hypothetical protein
MRVATKTAPDFQPEISMLYAARFAHDVVHAGSLPRGTIEVNFCRPAATVWNPLEQIHPRSRLVIAAKIRIALAPPFAHYPPMLARVLSAALSHRLVAPTCRAVAVAEAEAFPVGVEVNGGWGNTVIVQ